MTPVGRENDFVGMRIKRLRKIAGGGCQRLGRIKNAANLGNEMKKVLTPAERE